MNHLEEFDKSVDAFCAKLNGDALARAVAAAAEPIQAEAIARAPERSGALKAAIHTVVTHGQNWAQASVEVADSASGGQEHYAVFNEFGTSREAAEPFMRPAFEVTQGRAIEAFDNEIQKILES